jgi:peptidoglycan/xylan/chitin deacetylase (PgdA/CDA1 family)
MRCNAPRSFLAAGLSRAARACALIAALLLAACSTSAPPPAPPRPPAAAPAPPPPPMQGVLARDRRLALYAPRPGETYAGIAGRLLGSEARAWEIAELNGPNATASGTPLVLPIEPVNPVGVRPDRFQTVPILCYHRVGPGNSRMTVSASLFAQQLEWLADNGYTVIELRRLTGFLEGRQALPPRSVVISFDDGYESVYRHAYPLLKKHRMPATLFLYTDFVGTGGSALSWAQVQEMRDSGLVDVQAHSKTHANLIERLVDESDAQYRRRLDTEVRAPREAIARRLRAPEVLGFAYPYGDANEQVLDAMARHHYRLAVTVNPGGNPFYAQPLMLRRTMILGDHDLEDFKARLVVSRPIGTP